MNLGKIPSLESDAVHDSDTSFDCYFFSFVFLAFCPFLTYCEYTSKKEKKNEFLVIDDYRTYKSND